jgi:hypothetical protein
MKIFLRLIRIMNQSIKISTSLESQANYSWQGIDDDDGEVDLI